MHGRILKFWNERMSYDMYVGHYLCNVLVSVPHEDEEESSKGKE